ncbi:MAG TPA: protoglobin domain-containing protein, partial [Myxococcota bacterium]
DDDVARLRVLHPLVMPRVRPIVDRFYEIVLRFPDAAAVFADAHQVERLKLSLTKWVDQLLTGPFDHAYYEQRRRIGAVHVKVGLPSQYMFTAMNRLMEELHGIASEHALDVTHGRALRRIADIELAIMLGTYIDAREKQGLEGLRDLLISHLPTTVVLVDNDGRVATSTTPWNELFPGRRLEGLPVLEALHPEVVAQANLGTHLQRAVLTEREIVVPRVDVTLGGRAHTLRVAVIPLKHPLANALIHIEDLTETLATAARAKQAEHLAQLGTMAASVAHEIRNPLAGISGTVQVIANTLPVDDERRTALSKVQQQIARLGTLVGDLLNFARPISAAAQPVDLAIVAAGVANDAGASDGGRVAVVEGRGYAVADGPLLAQVLLNLVQNAWQAGAAHVTLRIEHGRIDVVDDGPGIAAAHVSTIFDPFFTTKVRGTGLGLPVAVKMIEAMRGSLTLATTATSSPSGTTFSITLPAIGRPAAES